jgi:hypothetical protein
MMKRKIHRYLFLVCGAVLALSAGFLLSPDGAQAQVIREAEKVGDYSITLNVMVPPPDIFDGPDAMAVCEGVAQPNRVSGCMSCQLTVFIEENGKPIDHAKVDIGYRRLSPKAGPWTEMFVRRSWVGPPGAQIFAKTPQTTHFGNQVELPAGSYEARVSVNGSGPAAFHFSLHR